jgi:hypothetical protein
VAPPGAAFRPAVVRPLSAEEQQYLADLFERLEGRWQGRTEGFICEGDHQQPRRRPDDHRLWLDFTVETEGDMNVQIAQASDANDSERMDRQRWYISAGYLRLNRNAPEGDVEIIAIKPQGFSVWERRQLRAPTGAAIRRSVRHDLELRDDGLMLQFAVYTHGVLTSMGTWRLEAR